MSQATVSYNTPGQASDNASVTINTSETVLVTITDNAFAKKSQLSIYYAITLGSATSVKLRYYYSPDQGTTWFQVPTKNDATGVLADIPSVVDSTSPSQSSIIKVIEDLPYSGSTAFKITGTAVGAAATLNSISVYTRDN